MLIRCWGARGSIPVSGPEYVKYGGDTTCIEIRTADDRIVIVDAGSGIRRLGNRLISEERFDYTMIWTHAHWDHLLGFPFFRPIYMRNARIAMFGCPFAQGSIHNILKPAMTPPYFPVKLEQVSCQIEYHESCSAQFSVGSMRVFPILLSHPNQGIGYKFVENGNSFLFLTDNELLFKHPGGLEYADYLKFSEGVDLLVHDAEYTEEEYKKTRGWGHSVYKDALRLAMEAGVKKFGLFHHNQDRTDPALDAILEECRRIVSDRGSRLECFALTQNSEIVL